MTKNIPITNSEILCIVDEHNYDQLMRRKWLRNPWNGLIQSTNRPYIRMHELVMGVAPIGYEWDHKDGNPANNCESNLRLATHSQNLANQSKPQGTYSSKYKGVSFKKANGNWVAQIGVEGKRIHIGSFPNEEDAARAYDTEAIKYFGEFANLNFREVMSSV